MTLAETVDVVCAAGEVVVARVRDSAGIYDVTHGMVSGWSCSCGDLACCHVAAVRQTTQAAG
jgi:hypothetical protein